MYGDTKDGGTIITLCNTQWIIDNNEKSIKFREFLSKINAMPATEEDYLASIQSADCVKT